MTVQHWLRSRDPAPHPQLLARMRDELDAVTDAQEEDVASASLSASLQVLRRVLARGDASRDVALDLLTADSLMTYACEAASESPESLEEVTRAMVAAVARETSSTGRGSLP